MIWVASGRASPTRPSGSHPNGGLPAPDAVVTVAEARGVDLHPLDVNDPAACERLASFIFADQPERAERLERALEIGRGHPPRLEVGDAASWLAERLTDSQADHRHRVVLHSMVLQYLSAEDRARIEASVQSAGASATPTAPSPRSVSNGTMHANGSNCACVPGPMVATA